MTDKGSEATLSPPRLLRATTETAYAMPLVSPVTLQGLELHTAVRTPPFPSSALTRYPVMVDTGVLDAANDAERPPSLGATDTDAGVVG